MTDHAASSPVLRRSARISTPLLKSTNNASTQSYTVKRESRLKKEKDGKSTTDTITPGPKQKNTKTLLKQARAEPPKLLPVSTTTAPYSTGDIDDAAPPSRKRVRVRAAAPDSSNAPLKTPGESRIMADASKPTSQLQLNSLQDHTTTENLLEKACAHLLAADARLKSVIDQHYCTVFSPEGLAEEVDPFRSLASGIMAQQISGAAATAVKNRFVALFNDEDGATPSFPTPAQVAATDIPRLRLAGLSERKAEYIQGLAAKFASGELSAEMLANASDDEILKKLTAVRGLGKWSVEMFACFGLKRTDILSTDDLGVQ